MSILRTMSVVICLLLSFLAPVSAAERILDYDVTIAVKNSGDIFVTEDITVKAEGKEIRRGIYRDFPLTNVERHQPRNPYKITNITRDGYSEKWFGKFERDNYRVYIGDKKKYVKRGIHRYRIQYKVIRAALKWDDYDEIYWNAIPANWAFPIDKASVEVILPQGTLSQGIRLFSGKFGSDTNTLNFAQVSSTKQNSYLFASTTPLQARTGFTFAIKIPKDTITPYAAVDSTKLVSFGIAMLILWGAGFGLVLLWYLVGRDPDKGVIFPRFDSPKKISAAGAAFLYKFGESTRDKLMATALVSLSSKGIIKFTHNQSFGFEIISDPFTNVSQGEAKLLDDLPGRRIGNSFNFIKEDEGTALSLQAARDNLLNILKIEYGASSLNENKPFFYIGLLAFGAALLTSFSLINKLSPWFFEDARNIVGMMGSTFMFLLFIAVKLGRGLLINSVAGLFKSGGSSKPSFIKYKILPNLNHVVSKSVSMINFAIYLSIIMVTGYLSYPYGWEVLAITIGMVLISIGFLFFTQAIKSPTQSGQKMLSYLRGLHMYMRTAESNQLKSEAPEKTPKQFSSLYPYAFALGLEAEWAEKFSAELKSWEETKELDSQWYWGNSYHRHHHHNHGYHHTIGGQLSNAISDSANYSLPSKSGGGFSGSGGGGFSGGGGGGGGGGGW